MVLYNESIDVMNKQISVAVSISYLKKGHLVISWR